MTRQSLGLCLFLCVLGGLANASSLIWHPISSDRSFQRVYLSQQPMADRIPDMTTSRRICVLEPTTKIDRHDCFAKEIADNLSIPIISPDVWSGKDEDIAFDHAIVLLPQQDGSITGAATTDANFALAIQPIMTADIKRLRRRRSGELSFAMKPIFIDFCPRDKSGQQPVRCGKDLLVQAVALRKHETSILDLTAGFGQDALVLANAGARKVTMVERDPVIHMLLDDACRRLELVAANCANQARRSLATQLVDKLHFVHGEGQEVARTLVQSAGSPDDLPDVVYIDQMFPPRTKRASVKKNMQVLHSLLQSQNDSGERSLEESSLLNVALSAARSRVVCKRPLSAPSIGVEGDHQPSFSVRGSTSRWDVYLKQQ